MLGESNLIPKEINLTNNENFYEEQISKINKHPNNNVFYLFLILKYFILKKFSLNKIIKILKKIFHIFSIVNIYFKFFNLCNNKDLRMFFSKKFFLNIYSFTITYNL